MVQPVSKYRGVLRVGFAHRHRSGTFDPACVASVSVGLYY